MYYWKITFDNNKIEYWQSTKSTYNFKTMFKPEAKVHIVKAEPLTKIMYLWYKYRAKQVNIYTLL